MRCEQTPWSSLLIGLLLAGAAVAQDPNEPGNGAKLTGDAMADADSLLLRVGGRAGPCEIGFQFVRYEPDIGEVETFGLYGRYIFEKGIAIPIGSVLNPILPIDLFPPSVSAQPYGGVWIETDKDFHGFGGAPIAGLMFGPVIAEYAYRWTSGRIQDALAEEGIFRIGLYLELP